MKGSIHRTIVTAGVATILGLGSSAFSADRVRETVDNIRDNMRFSDRTRMTQWEKGKEELTRGLPVGEEKDFYRRELQKRGYQITSINSDTPEYAEYEIVKGDETYEVGIDMDKASHKATKVEVSSNMWKADKTEQALNAHRGKNGSNKKDRSS